MRDAQLGDYYESRWLVKEYHQALMTGCVTESRQLKTAVARAGDPGWITIWRGGKKLNTDVYVASRLTRIE